MKRLTVIMLAITAAAFTAAWFFFPDISSLPLCWFISASLVGGFYALDRYGFDEVDTIDLFYTDPKLYVAYMYLYASLIVAGHIIGFGVIG